MDDCLVCGNGKAGGKHICKMCGMRFDRGVEANGMIFCSASCVTYYDTISKKSPEMAGRDVVI